MICVAIRYIFPFPKGLFHRAIAHSASAFVYWAIRDVSSSLTTKLGKRFNCALHNSTALVDCLRRTPSAFLVSEQFNLWVSESYIVIDA